MKALSEAALDLPWLAPCVGTLTTLARAHLSAAWPQLRADPALVLLLARLQGSCPSRALLADDSTLLEAILTQLQPPAVGFVDWKAPGPARIYQASLRQAQIASALAARIGCDAERAWTGGLLAPMGWLAAAAIDPEQSVPAASILASSAAVLAWQREAWGLDHTGIARRLSRLWRLPDWLSTILGQLSLNVNIATRLGAEPVVFQVVQLAVLLYQQREPGLALVVGSDITTLLRALNLQTAPVEALVAEVLNTPVPDTSWEAPERYPLLQDLLKLALERRRQHNGGSLEAVQRDLDRLQEVLEQQCTEEGARLQALKLSALAELAAGAGHEINNPLAVISGQAQYVLKQLQLLDGPAEEIDDVGVYLDNLRGKVVASLHKILGQTQRIYGILTDLMQFARPQAPRLQSIDLAALTRDVLEALGDLARERRVRLVFTEPKAEVRIDGDPTQLRVVLAGLLRNAIEAAPADGWAGMRVETGVSRVDVVVEDNGQGPAPAAQEHLFDPFFSGRSAGRGRGLGLPTAWRLARQHGGDVRFDAVSDGVTRFVLSLPLPTPATNGRHGDALPLAGRNGSNGAH